MKTQTYKLVIALLWIATVLSVNVTFAQKDQRIRFAKGSNSGIVMGVISTPNSGETYVIGAKTGQKMILEFDAIDSAMPVIMVYPPGKTSEDSKILDEGSGGEYAVDLETSGDYRLFIGCGRKCTYTLKVTIK
jgi:hypothetical protein